jgi:hypothetical protein
MDKVRKLSNSECYTPSSEPFRFYTILIFNVDKFSLISLPRFLSEIPERHIHLQFIGAAEAEEV